MKKSLLIVGLLMAMSLSATAQYDGPAFGFRLGPNFNWITSSKGGADNEKVPVGFDLGFVFEYYFTENYAFVTGVNVNFLRGAYDFKDMRNISLDSISNYQLGDVERKFKTTEYEIPLMLKMVTPEIGNLPLRAYAQIGGAFGITPVVKVKDDFDLNVLEEMDYLDDAAYRAAKGEYNPIHASLRAGIGAEYAFLETTRAFLGVYYSYDFLNGIGSGGQGIFRNNYRLHYYDADGNVLGDRTPKLDIHQHRIGVEVGILF
jgi:hypothetical protein